LGLRASREVSYPSGGPRGYPSPTRIDCHQKAVREREINYDSLSALLQQLPIVSDAASFDDIQYIKIYFDNQIKSTMEDIEKMTHIH
jgi:hypothetical protein